MAILVKQKLIATELIALNFRKEAAIKTFGPKVKITRGQLQIWNFDRPPAKGGFDTSEAEPHLENWPINKNVIISADANDHGAWDNERETDTLGE